MTKSTYKVITIFDCKEFEHLADAVIYASEKVKELKEQKLYKKNCISIQETITTVNDVTYFLFND